jgi:hypothetical protein
MSAHPKACWHRPERHGRLPTDCTRNLGRLRRLGIRSAAIIRGDVGGIAKDDKPEFLAFSRRHIGSACREFDPNPQPPSWQASTIGNTHVACEQATDYEIAVSSQASRQHLFNALGTANEHFSIVRRMSFVRAAERRSWALTKDNKPTNP